jgi:hypothetical protein
VGALVFLGATVALAQYSNSADSYFSKTFKFDTVTKNETMPIDATEEANSTSNTPAAPQIESITVSQSSSPTPAASAFPKANPTPTPATKTQAVVTPTPTPTPTPRIPNPPNINLGYPNEGQTITMTPSQTLCAVDIPAGGNTKGLQRRHKHNNDSWSSYAPHSSLCWSPPNGNNTLQVQYKNQDGDESSIITRNFIFNRLEEVSYTITGKVYGDLNCNAQKDSGESYLSNIFGQLEMPEYTILNSGDATDTFTYTGKIMSNESATIKIKMYGKTNYMTPLSYSHPSVTFNKDKRSQTVEAPAVPYDLTQNCP